MPEELFGLTNEDRQLLKQWLEMMRKQRVNPVNRPHVEEPESQTPDVYIALTPPAGIAANDVTAGTAGAGTTGGVTGATPGSADCSVYRLDLATGDLIYTGFTQKVYNLSTSAIGGNEWVNIARDKWGTWLATDLLQPGTPAGEQGDVQLNVSSTFGVASSVSLLGGTRFYAGSITATPLVGFVLRSTSSTTLQNNVVFARSRDGGSTDAGSGDVVGNVYYVARIGGSYVQVGLQQAVVGSASGGLNWQIRPNPATVLSFGFSSNLGLNVIDDVGNIRISMSPTTGALGLNSDSITVNNVFYLWPSANASGVLTNNGLGTLTWTALSVDTANIADNSITNAKLRDSAALSVIGRNVNSSGDPADIAATNGSGTGVLTFNDASNILQWTQSTTPGVFTSDGSTPSWQQDTDYGALTDNSGGTGNDTIAAVSGSGDDATINDNFADVATMLSAIRTTLKNIKAWS